MPALNSGAPHSSTLRCAVSLHRGDRYDLARALDVLDADSRDADMADPARIDVLGDRPERLLERRVRVDAMEVEETERLGAQRAQALLDLRAEHLRPPLAAVVAA